jgi:hypothetical protein
MKASTVVDRTLEVFALLCFGLSIAHCAETPKPEVKNVTEKVKEERVPPVIPAELEISYMRAIITRQTAEVGEKSLYQQLVNICGNDFSLENGTTPDGKYPRLVCKKKSQ